MRIDSQSNVRAQFSVPEEKDNANLKEGLNEESSKEGLNEEGGRHRQSQAQLSS